MSLGLESESESVSVSVSTNVSKSLLIVIVSLGLRQKRTCADVFVTVPVKVPLRWVPELTLGQCLDDPSETALIENNGLAPNGLQPQSEQYR